LNAIIAGRRASALELCFDVFLFLREVVGTRCVASTSPGTLQIPVHLGDERMHAIGIELEEDRERPVVEVSTKIALRAIEIANLLALGNTAQVPDRLQTMIDSLVTQPDDFKVTWTFSGTQHFIDQHAPLAPYRTWLGQLFSALKTEDRQMALTGLQAARAGFQAVAK
jgi:hypothetical protein